MTQPEDIPAAIPCDCGHIWDVLTVTLAPGSATALVPVPREPRSACVCTNGDTIVTLRYLERPP